MTDRRRAALRGMLALPFVLMPLPLTLLAWDLYGGFALHGGLALGLALLGGLGGAAWPSARGWWTRTGARWGASAGPLVLLGAGTFWGARILGTMAHNLADRSMTPPRPPSEWSSLDLLWLAAWAGVVLRLGLARGEHRRARAGLLSLAWSSMALGWAAWSAGAAPLAVPVAGLGIAVGISIAAPRMEPRVSMGAARALRALPPTLLLGFYCSRFGRDLLPFHHALGISLTTAGGGLAGGLLGFGLGALEPGWDRACLRVGEALAGQAAKGFLGALLILLAVVGGIAVEPVGEVFAWSMHARSAFGFPDGQGGVVSQGADPGLLLRAAFALVLLRGGLVAKTGRDVRRFLGLGALTWSALVLFQLYSLAPVRGLRLGLQGLVLATALLPWLDRLRDRPLGGRLESAGLLLAPMFCGPLLGRYVAAALPGLGEPAGIAVLGAGLGLLVGVVAIRLRPRGESTAWGFARRAGLALLSLGLVIYLAVFYALFAWRFAAVVAALATLVLGSRLARSRAWPVPRVGGLVALWLLFYASFFSVVAFKAGSSPEACAAVHERTSARVLLRRFAEGGDYPSADPYDVLPDRSGRWLIVTFKRFDQRGGFVEVLDIDAPERRSRLMTEPPDGRGPLWPERFELDPQTGLLYFGMLGIDNYSLWEVELTEAEEGPAALQVLRRAPLAFEPSYPAVDLRRRRLVQPYLAPGVVTANQTGLKMPLVETVDLVGLYSTGRYRVDADSSAMAEYVAVDQRSGHYYVPAYFNLVRFALLEVDGDTHALRRKLETFHPTIGLVVDEEARRLYVTNSVGGTLDAYDLDRWERVAAVPCGAFPRDVAFDASTGRLYVGNYSGGTVSVFETREGERVIPPRRVDVVEVGPVLRGVGIHEASGRAFAASACGVFEVTSR